MEQGKLMDEYSSLEMKRLFYLTRRRVRYVYSKALNDSAVFFKSGSLYKCQPEEGFECGKYRGNHTNVLNSIVTVETPRSKVVEVTAKDASTKAADLGTNTQKGPVSVAKKSDPSAKVSVAGAEKVNPEGASAEKTATLSKTVELPPLVYIVAVMSNELKRNASFDHALLAGEIHQLVQSLHP